MRWRIYLFSWENLQHISINYGYPCLQSVEEVLCSGWAFFFPYLLLSYFLVVWMECLNTSSTLYWDSFFTCLWSFWVILKSYKNFNLKNCLVKVSLFISSNEHTWISLRSWTHFWRIFQWKNIDLISDANSNYKFSYFWGYSLFAGYHQNTKYLQLIFTIVFGDYFWLCSFTSWLSD